MINENKPLPCPYCISKFMNSLENFYNQNKPHKMQKCPMNNPDSFNNPFSFCNSDNFNNPNNFNNNASLHNSGNFCNPQSLHNSGYFCNPEYLHNSGSFYYPDNYYNLENLHYPDCHYKMQQCPYHNLPYGRPDYNKQLPLNFMPLNSEENEEVADDPIILKDYGPEPFVINIERATRQNTAFRVALWTGNHLQLTLMSINPGHEIGLEIHPNLDQFIRIEEGHGLVKMGDKKDNLDFQANVRNDYAFIIPAGKWHNLINTGNMPLKLYSIYAPPQHPYGTFQVTG